METSFDLGTGQSIPLRVNRSARAHHVRLRLSFPEGLVLTLPSRFRWMVAAEILACRREWVAAQVERLLAEGCDFQAGAVLPETIELRAVPGQWEVAYLAGPGSTTVVQGAGRLLVRGRIEDHASCRAALKRWIGRQARVFLPERLAELAGETGLKFTRITIRDQRTRWGSCTAKGTISLNQKLLFLPPDLVRYVMVHELCHGLELNHSARFWALVRSLEPHMKTSLMRMRRAWSMVPGWAA
jgi:predicted metal-dependent hydrolase